MNTIKYINPQTGQLKSFRMSRGQNWQKRGIAQADFIMGQMGFVRRGLRYRHPAAKEFYCMQKHSEER